MKQRLYAVVALLLFLTVVILFYNRYSFTGSQSSQPLTVTDYKLNTYVTVSIYDSNDTTLLNECMALCDKYELIFSYQSGK